MITKVVVLLVASSGYQPIEYGVPRMLLEQAGIQVKVASDAKPTAYAQPGSSIYATAHVDYTLDEINPDAIDGLFVIGGPGALEYLDNQATYNIVQQVAQRGKPYGAICISPRILAHAGLLQGKKATGWNGDGKVQAVFKKYKAQYVGQPAVVDGNVITADGPQSANGFGRAIVEVIKR